MDSSNQPTTDISFLKVTREGELPAWATRETLVDFFHETMKPYEDTREDINSALDYMFSQDRYAGGYLMLGKLNGKLAGAVLMLHTGMGGYVPEDILLFISVDPELRGKGIGGRLMEQCWQESPGDVKLHVDFDNPARRLYERMGMKHVYAEMRLKRQ
jgi:GNAT superfamily N-acetyltransferase